MYDVENNNISTNNVDYLNPRQNLKNYILDEGDTINLKFLKTPELDGNFTVDREGEIFLWRLNNIYIKGLNIYELKNLLEKRFKDYLIDPVIEVRISKFRFINSGLFLVNPEGEVYLPEIEETYVRGLTTKEISDLLSKKYQDSEFIYPEIKVIIVGFKRQRVLVSGEIRKPGFIHLSHIRG